LLAKDINPTILKLVNELKEISSRQLKENMKNARENNENINKKIENIKKN
jgi:hypothetical protein